MTSRASPSASPSRCPDRPAASWRTFALVVEYDGRGYAGWQAQAGQRSIAGALAEACRHLTGHADARFGCAGRTDAGVHARAQLAEVRLPAGSAHGTVARAWARPSRLVAGLNHFLPATVRVHRARRAADGFTARRAAVGKIYRYALHVGATAPALEDGRTWHVRRALDVGAMRAAAQHLVGAHDFEAFRHAHCDAPHARRHLWRLECREGQRPPHGRRLLITLAGNAFCRHMCRILVGTLVGAGAGACSAADVAAILRARDRRRAGPTAPAAGLTLWRVIVAPRRPAPTAPQAAAAGDGANPALASA